MHGIFLASGPGLPRGVTVGEISVVDVYPLMLELLRIEAPSPPSERGRLRSVLFGED
jgi:hypothetical protein